MALFRYVVERCAAVRLYLHAHTIPPTGEFRDELDKQLASSGVTLGDSKKTLEEIEAAVKKAAPTSTGNATGADALETKAN